MSPGDECALLRGEIEKHASVMDRIDGFFRDFDTKHGDWATLETEAAIAAAQMLCNFYTCVETVFLRISRFFENSLVDRKWHADLLEKMTIRVPGVRERVISEESHVLLLELLKFRHFCRYYFEFDYDRDTLVFLRKKYRRLVPLLKNDLHRFLDFLVCLGSEEKS